MRILFVSRWFPFPPDNGSKIRVYNLLRGLARHHEITLLSFISPSEQEAGIDEMLSLCHEVKTVVREDFRPGSWRALAGFFAVVPRSVVDTFSPQMAQEIRDTLGFRDYDLVIASQEGTAAYADCFRGVPAVFEEVEVAVLYERWANAQSLWPRLRHGLTWAKQKRFLCRLLKCFEACTVVSELERDLLFQALGSEPTTEIIPNCVNVEDYAAFKAEEPRGDYLAFTGSFRYDPNYEAMVWFVREVFPEVRKRLPEMRLVITGDHADKPLPSSRGVTLAGRVDDVRPVVGSAAASLAPIWSGGGTRLKILEAMALKTPVVATSKGAEGLEVRSGEHLLIADTPAGFADAIDKILNDPEIRQSLTENAFQLVSRKYDWTAVMPSLLNLLGRVAGEGIA